MRLRGHDYGAPATYFVTLCTQERKCWFGEVVGAGMMLAVAGLMIESWWYSLEGRFRGVTLDEMLVIPNHFHGIVTIGADSGVEPLPSLSDVMYWFKSITTHDYSVGVKNFGFEPFPGRLWQKRFYERILWEERDLDGARAYIQGNTAAWVDDNENPMKA